MFFAFYNAGLHSHPIPSYLCLIQLRMSYGYHFCPLKLLSRAEHSLGDFLLWQLGDPSLQMILLMLRRIRGIESRSGFPPFGTLHPTQIHAVFSYLAATLLLSFLTIHVQVGTDSSLPAHNLGDLFEV